MQFLKKLLDNQLNSLVNNMKAMQNENSQIELETIQRLQLVEKFGDDARSGLEQAKSQKERLDEDLSLQ